MYIQLKQYWAIFFSLTLLFSSTVALGLHQVATDEKPTWCIVIDPGHGGKDPGTLHKTTYEKDINLAVAQKLGEKLSEQIPNIKVIYTRNNDTFIELSNRCEIANRAKADLFISIHTNSNPSETPSGSETYIMGVDQSEKNLQVAMRENDVVTYEADYSQKYQGYEAGSTISMIMFSMMQYTYQNQSINLASLIEKQYNKHETMKSRGVKQAGFLVLYNAAMPSVLTELGFISNKTDREYLTSAKGQDEIAESICNAILLYFGLTPTTNYSSGQNNNSQQNQTNTTSSQKPTNGNVTQGETQSSTGNSSQPKSSGGSSAKPTGTNSQPKSTGTTSQPKPSGTTSQPKSTGGSSAKPTGTTTAKSGGNSAKPTGKQSVIFKIQVKAAKTPIEINSKNFGPYVTRIVEVKEGSFYKYMVGSEKNYKEALSLQTKLRDYFPDAFCVAYLNSEPITIDKAKKILNEN